MSDPRYVGAGSCTGGTHPDPPIHDYPLLVWVGGVVRTEDGRASVEDIARASALSADIHALAARFGTTPEHVMQAVGYAAMARPN